MKTIIEQLTHPEIVDEKIVPPYEEDNYDNHVFLTTFKRITTSLGDICFRTNNLMLQREVEDFLELVKQKYN